MLCSHSWSGQSWTGPSSTSMRLLVYARHAAEGRHSSVLLQADSLLCRSTFPLSAHALDDIAQLVLLLWKSMCPRSTLSSPYFHLLVPTLQLPLEPCENTWLFQCHGNWKEKGLVWSECVSECLCLRLREDVTFTIASSTRTSSPLWCLREFQTCHFLSLCFWFPFIFWHLFSLKLAWRNENQWTHSNNSICPSVCLMH